MQHEGSLPYSQQPVICSYQRSSFHAPFPFYFFKVLFQSLFFRFTHQNSVCIFLLLQTCHMSRPSYLLRFHHPSEIWEAPITELLVVSLFPVSCYVCQCSRTNFSAPSVYIPPSIWHSTSHAPIKLQAQLQLCTFQWLYLDIKGEETKGCTEC